MNLSLRPLFGFQKAAIRLFEARSAQGRTAAINLTIWLCTAVTLSAFHATEKQRHPDRA
jgi:hypothetical protein